MAKEVQVSPSGDDDFKTLPGNTAELTSEGETLNDTIFGQEFQSQQPAEISWTLTANALYKGFAGYQARIMTTAGETSTPFTQESVDDTDAPIYQITSSTMRLWDPDTAVVVEDDSTDISDEIEWIDYLNGRFKLNDAYTPTGTITVTGASFGSSQLGTMNTFTLTQNAESIDESDLEQLQGNNGFRLMRMGLKTVSLELSGFHSASAALLEELKARNLVIVEIGPDGQDDSFARGFFKPTSRGQSGDVGQLEEESITFELFVPDNALLLTPFKWYHADNTTLNQALLDVLDAWETGAEVDLRYLYDGTNGWAGAGIPTDVSLSGGLGALNEFSLSFAGDGELTAHP